MTLSEFQPSILKEGILIRRHNIGKGHAYEITGDPRVEGKKLISTTTILGIINKPALVPWMRSLVLSSTRKVLTSKPLVADPDSIEAMMKSIEEEVSRAQTIPIDYGQMCHAIIQNIIRGNPVPIDLLPKEVQPVISTFLEWQEDSGLKIDTAEVPLYSATHGYGCTIDAVAWDGSDPIAIDWKTGKAVYPEYALQVAANAWAFGECTGIYPKKAYIIRFGRDTPDFEVREVKDLITAMDGFLAAKKLYEILKQPLWAGGNH